MLVLTSEELRNLLFEETDIDIKEGGFGKEYVQLEYPPMDISSDDILINENNYYIEMETLLHVLKDEIFSVMPTITYDKKGHPQFFLVDA